MINNRDFPLGSTPRSNIEDAIAWWNRNTYLKLINRGRHKDFIEFVRGTDATACSSPVGKQGGRQVVRCNANFADAAGTVAHEIGHALGLLHEHQRRDRNKHVIVRMEHVTPHKRKSNFEIRHERKIGEYNFDSIMHYRNRSFHDGNDTIVPRNGEAIGQRKRLSPGDIRTIEIAYHKSGDLLWYHHTGFHNGIDPFAQNYGERVGTGWQRFSKVVMAPEGIIYGIEKNGDLKWYKHEGVRTGSAFEPGHTGVRVGSGWQRFRTVFAGPAGLLYAVEKNGDLRCYRHLGFRDGSARWEDNGKIVGSGWQRFRNIFATSNNVIYAVEKNGDLKWYRHTGARTRSATFADRSGRRVGTGWDRFRYIVATTAGFIYAVEKNLELKWYQHRGFLDGANRWAHRTGVLVGTGWAGELLASDSGVLYRRLFKPA